MKHVIPHKSRKDLKYQKTNKKTNIKENMFWKGEILNKQPIQHLKEIHLRESNT